MLELQHTPKIIARRDLLHCPSFITTHAILGASSPQGCNVSSNKCPLVSLTRPFALVHRDCHTGNIWVCVQMLVFLFESLSCCGKNIGEYCDARRLGGYLFVEPLVGRQRLGGEMCKQN